ncbi:uncharacterized protein LOC115220762 [Octopus sinensis]|uniref:Uncharacterized protein LOC115220762 n=1 Tax=Octopus sinensis TaxID=2607531 RepID=A0A6P7T970_9MOLL|nr:uncharacterized protein LOC115220762 [Octopus sinensis]
MKKLCYSFKILRALISTRLNDRILSFQVNCNFFRMDKIWHCGVMKYLQKNDLSPKDISAVMIGILEDDTPVLSSVQEWVFQFVSGRESPEDDPRSGRPATSTPQENIDHIQQMLMNDRRWTINQRVNAISISDVCVKNILHNELGMTKAFARWVLCLLIIDQKFDIEPDPAGGLDRF